MKTKLLLLALFITSISFAQSENITITDVITILSGDHLNSSQSLTVPAGKMWVLNSNSSGTVLIRVKFVGSDVFSSLTTQFVNSSLGYILDKDIFLTPGMELFFNINIGVIQILEYDAPSTFDGTLAINEQSFMKDNLILYPNPTDSQLTIDSDKAYRIEVYDMNGRKLIETKGNTIDFSKLSSAIYVVKLFDDVDNVISSYKVIKN